MSEPTAGDLRKILDFKAALDLPTERETALALIAQMPDENDKGACLCAFIGICTEDENACPYCRTIDMYDGCPELGYGCGLIDDDCDCCTLEQKKAAARNGVTP